MKKQILSIALVFALACLLLAGCGSNAETANQPAAASTDPAPAPETSATAHKVAITVYDIADKIPAYIVKGVEHWSNELYPGEFDFTILDGKADVSTQMQLVSDSLVAGIEALFIHPVDDKACVTIAEACQEENVPVWNIGKELRSGYTAFFGYDEYQLGEIASEAVKEMVGDRELKVAIIGGTLGMDNTTKRTQATKDVCEKYGWEVVAEEYTLAWGRSEAMAITENWLTGGVEFDAIITNWDEGAIGAGLALEGAGKNLDDYIVVGMDSNEDGLEFIKSGHMDISVFASTSDLCRGAVEAAHAYFSGEEYPTGPNYIELFPVTEENIEETLTLMAY